MAINSAFSYIDPQGEQESAALELAKQSQNVLQQSLAQRQQQLSEPPKQLFDPVLLAMAQGFLAPTKTGGFGESIANAAGLVGPAQAAQERAARENAQMRFELAQQQYQMNQQNLTDMQRRRVLGSLYSETTDDSGAKRQQINPLAFQQLGQLTGNPEYIIKGRQLADEQDVKNISKNLLIERTDASGNKLLEVDPKAIQRLVEITGNPKDVMDFVEQQRKERTQRAYSGVFKPTEDGKFTVDPKGMANLFSTAGPENITNFVKSVIEMRKLGLISGAGASDVATPFDSLMLLADNLGPSVGPAFKAQAQRLAKQYSQGLIDEEKATTLSNQMLTTMNATVGSQEARNNTKVNQAFQRYLASESAARAREAHDAKIEEQKNKLTDQQKIEFNKMVVPIVNEGVKANSALMQVEALKSKIEKAPSGAFAGAFASSVGALFGTDQNTALREIEALSKGLIPLIPRLPGAASNLDATNLEKSIGNLKDPMLTNDQRRALVKNIYDGFKRLSDRADAVSSHWDQYKKFDPKVLSSQPAPAAPQSSGIPVWDPATKSWK